MTKIIINKSISQHWSEFISSPFHEKKKTATTKWNTVSFNLNVFIESTVCVWIQFKCIHFILCMCILLPKKKYQQQQRK